MAITALSFGDEEINIDAKVSLSSLNTVIAMVKQSDDLPVIGVDQEKVESKTITINDGNGKAFHPRMNDPDTPIITTGIVNGPLDGHGKIHKFKMDMGKWILISVSNWVS